MKKILASLLLLAVITNENHAQTSTVQAPRIGFSLIGNDYNTPKLIRTTSLTAVFRDKKFASFKEMGHGLAIHYIKGLTSKTDLNVSLAGSFVKFSLPGKTSSQDKFLLEADASANFKMLEYQTTVNPYLIAGVGASKYTNVLGAFVPVGGGITVNIFGEAQFFTQFQYRIPVTTEANDYHFQVSFGISSFL